MRWPGWGDGLAELGLEDAHFRALTASVVATTGSSTVSKIRKIRVRLMPDRILDLDRERLSGGEFG